MMMASYRLTNLVMQTKEKSKVLLFFLFFVLFACLSLMIHLVLKNGFCGMDLTIDIASVYQVFRKCNQMNGSITLTRIQGLDVINLLVQALGGKVSIVSNTNLAHIKLDTLFEISQEGSLVISNNPRLEDFEVEKLNFLKGSLTLSGNPEIETLDFSSLKQLSGSLIISNNTGLQKVIFGSLLIVPGEIFIKDVDRGMKVSVQSETYLSPTRCESNDDCPSEGTWTCQSICMPFMPIEWFSGANPFDLQYSQIVFRPTSTGIAYDYCINKGVDSFSVSSSLGNKIFLRDDDSKIFPLMHAFTFFGQSYSSVYVGSNGYLSFKEEAIQYFQPTFPATPRISAFYDDLDPSASGDVKIYSTSDRFVATFVNIPQYGSKTSTNSFQYEMFFSTGEIRITYLKMDSRSGFVGILPGSITPSRAVDLSRIHVCRA